ncbi:glutathione S-transferase family protein [Sphingobium nicotianae]|uniref:Glutathione S-transferase family protein n=1 Tax=Sphingobium nicotianae TaxID=2782607 RepID=A0A9X1DD28_9SPHN|nr:glutathione S-transferase family protein [Sphingobium nicotianae]MBT2187937.1 glutathione S-transferase family protein [Sphingobium nicotianae]
MHLIGSLASPFVQRCLIVAHAKGHEIDVAPPPGGSMQSAEFQAISPMGRIPILALDDGSHMCESGAIVAYLDEALSGPSLLPASPAQRGRAREIEAIAVVEFATGMRPFLVHRVFRMSENEPVVTAALAQAEKGCVALARLMGDDPYAVGDRLSIADAVMVPFVTLASIISIVPEIADLLTRHSFLTAYLDRAQADPVLARATSEMRQSFAAIMARNAQPATS